jgi:hypothetical protein
MCANNKDKKNGEDNKYNTVYMYVCLPHLLTWYILSCKIRRLEPGYQA